MEAHVTDLKSVKELGRGAYGVVEKMVHVPSGKEMAVKVKIELILITESQARGDPTLLENDLSKVMQRSMPQSSYLHCVLDIKHGSLLFRCLAVALVRISCEILKSCVFHFDPNHKDLALISVSQRIYS